MFKILQKKSLFQQLVHLVLCSTQKGDVAVRWGCWAADSAGALEGGLFGAKVGSL